MTRPQRRAHLVIWLALAPALLLAVILLLRGAPDPVAPPSPDPAPGGAP